MLPEQHRAPCQALGGFFSTAGSSLTPEFPAGCTRSRQCPAGREEGRPGCFRHSHSSLALEKREFEAQVEGRGRRCSQIPRPGEEGEEFGDLGWHKELGWWGDVQGSFAFLKRIPMRSTRK